VLFGYSLTEIDERLMSNLKTTKSVFPDEIKLIESGMLLFRDVTKITDEASKDYTKNPNMFANHNLFARNRQLLLNAYISCLIGSYGTAFVILRTVLENNNLIRFFNKKPQCAYEWLPKEQQQKFDPEIQKKFGISGKVNATFDPMPVTKLVFDDKTNPQIEKEINKFYGQLCNYTHPNFTGWKELVAYKGDIGVIQNMPTFLTVTAENVVGVLLFSMIFTFKAFVETFKGYLIEYADQLMRWNNDFVRIMTRYTNVE
jgi:hypothetical protein